MSDTYYAIKRRERAARKAAAAGGKRPSTVQAPKAEEPEGPSYRDQQARAQELGIPANQSSAALAEAIAAAEAEQA